METGRHDNCVALNPRLVTSKDKGTPGVEMEFKNSDGDEITATLYITDGTIKRTVESLRHTGWRGDDFSDLSSVGSKLCQIVVEAEEYKGKWYPRVKWVNANESQGGASGDGQPRMDPATAKRFAAQMRGQVIAASGGKPAAPPARAPGGAPRAPATRPASAMPPRPPADHMPEPPPDDFGRSDDLTF